MSLQRKYVLGGIFEKGLGRKDTSVSIGVCVCVCVRVCVYKHAHIISNDVQASESVVTCQTCLMDSHEKNSSNTSVIMFCHI